MKLHPESKCNVVVMFRVNTGRMIVDSRGNPDFSLVLQEFLNTGELLPYTGQVVVDGSPGDWTLVSYDGVDVPQDPGLGTELFVAIWRYEV